METSMFQMFLGMPGMAQMPVADISLQHPEFFPVDSGVENFQNVLDLVSDISLADSQSPEFTELLSESLKGVEDRPTQDLEVQLNQSQIAMQGVEKLYELQLAQGVNVQPVGQNLQKNSEMDSNKIDLQRPLDTFERTALTVPFMSQVAQVKQPKGESVQMWAAGIAMGDIESVKVVEPQTPHPHRNSFVSARDINTESVISQQIMEPQVPAESVKSVPVSTEFREGLVEKQSALPSEQKIQNPQLAVQQTKLSVKENPQQAMQQDFENVVKETPKKAMTDNQESQSPQTSWKSEEFILGEQTKTAKKVEPNAQVSDLAPMGAFVTQDLVNQRTQGVVAGDSRLSSHSVGFVAEKVQNLMEQGGGFLKVEMNPKNLGNLEIRVALRPGGGVDVKIIAEKDSTRLALQSSQGELFNRIESSVGKTQLEISPRIQSGNAFEIVKQAPVQDNFISSQDMGQMLDGRWDMKTETVKTEGLSQIGSQTMTQSRNQEGFSREDSRSRAMEQWEEQFRERKSA